MDEPEEEKEQKVAPPNAAEERAAQLLARLQRRDAKRGRLREPKEEGEDEAGDAPASRRRRLGSSASSSKELCYDDVLSRTRPVRDLDDLVRCPGKPVPNVSLILKLAQEQYNRYGRGGSAEGALGASSTSSSSKSTALYVELQEKRSRNEAHKPIILVPCNKKAPVNLMNVYGFLQHGKYQKLNEERMRFFESSRPESVEVERHFQGDLWVFEVRDQFKDFRPAEWKRTVAVIADGQPWQFKGFPFQNLVDVFTTIRGFYFQEAGHGVPEHVKKWNVKIIPLARTHMDHRFSEARDSFFSELEDVLRSERRQKFKNGVKLEPERQDRVIVKQVL